MGTTLDCNDQHLHIPVPSTMKSVIALCLFGLALGAPRPQEEAIDLPDEVVQEVVEEAIVEEAPVELAVAPVADIALVQAVVNTRAEGEPVAILRQETSLV